MDIRAKENQAIAIGRVGENEHIRVIFDVSDLIGELGTDISFTLLHQKPGEDTAYPVPTAVFDGDELIWTVTAADNSAQGRGRCELICTVGDMVAKTVIWSTVIQTALDGSGEVPDVWESWQEVFAGLKAGAEAAAETAQISASESLERADAALQYSLNAGQSANNAVGSAAEARRYAVEAEHTARDVQHDAENAEVYARTASDSSREAQTASASARSAATAAAESAAQITGLTAAAETLPEGSAATAQYDAETGVLTLGIPKGETGAAGPQGDPGEDYVLTAEDKAEIAGMINAPVTDVQVDSSSVVSDGVANVPIASANTPGVVKIGTGLAVNSSDVLYVRTPTDANVKAGTSAQHSITPEKQHAATFYGLAKAAGDTSQSASENAVGAYTDEARKAIKKMLGIYDEWELIADVTVGEDSAAFVIDTDIEGQGFALSQMLVRIWLNPATTGQNDNVGTTSLGVNAAGADVNANSILVRYVGGGAATYMELKYELVCGASLANTSAAALPQSTAYLSKATSAADDIAYYRGFRLKQQSASTSLIPSGSIVKIYGIRI